MLTPAELKSKQVIAKRKKYDKYEMDVFLNEVYQNYEELYNENKSLENKMKLLSDGVQYYHSIETTLQQALVLAEKTANETKEAAMLKADSIEKEAKTKAGQIVSEAEKEYTQIKQQAYHLVQQFNQYKLQLKQAASAQLELVNSNTFDIYAPEINAMYQKETPILEEKENIIEAVAKTEDIIAKTEEIASEELSSITEEIIPLEEVTVKEEELKFHNSAMEGNTIEIKPVKAAIVLEPIDVVTSKPLEAIVNKVEVKPSVELMNDEIAASNEPQSLDALLKDLNIKSRKSSKKDKKTEEEDPFEFLGSIDDF